MGVLADIAAVPADHIKDFLLIGLAIAGFVFAVLMYFKRGKTEVQPQPLEVRGSGPSTSELDKRVSALEQAVDHLRRELKVDREALDDADEGRASRIHSRMDEMRRDLEDKIQQLPGQIIAILRNSGAIK